MREEGTLSRVTRLPVATDTSSALVLEPLPPRATATAAPPSARAPAPAPASASASASASAVAVARQIPQELCLANGSRARITPAGLVVGRRRRAGSARDDTPSTGDAAPSPPRLEVHDPTRSLSREHARLELGDDGIVSVEDLASGNGTTVQRPDGTTTALVPGTAVALMPGDVLQMGAVVASLRDATPRAGPGHRADD
ncbi:FHA domain-containing protein [Frigoribacterium sp. PvP032]|uniref:FHA domain-containing protein n=1 Tax=Frigoribacterium sp. PvP032 TaxID=2806589 RepID=UPI001FD73211|nr:FHA domain-containing protein [Frigoribacterium sp. PvP032]